MCLMFDYTKQMFHKWLMLGIGTMFSLAVMSFTVTLALDAILAVTASFWAGKLLLGSNPEGVTSVAMQQGGLGLFMTALIVSAPPMAAAFFQGTIGQFAAYNQFGQNAASGGGGQQRLPDGRPLGGGSGTNQSQNVASTGSAFNATSGAKVIQSSEDLARDSAEQGRRGVALNRDSGADKNT